jgi:putative oxidoreductase
VSERKVEVACASHHARAAPSEREHRVVHVRYGAQERSWSMTETHKRETRAAVLGLTLLRMTAGVILAAHGWEKLVDFHQWRDTVAGLGMPMPNLMAALAVAGELGGGVGLILGLLARVAAFGAAAVMTTAIALVHIHHGLFAQNNGFEYPLMLWATAVFFMLRGAGPISIDALWSNPRERVVVNEVRSGREHSHAGRRHQPSH